MKIIYIQLLLFYNINIRVYMSMSVLVSYVETQTILLIVMMNKMCS